MQIEGRPLIAHVVERARASRRIDDVILATTVAPTDDALQAWAQDEGVRVTRGPVDDVLRRYLLAADAAGADVIVRITADDPMKDPDVIDATIELYRSGCLDFAYNNQPPSFPEGLDVEVFSVAALRLADDKAADPFEREHVTQYFYRNPKLFRQANYAYSRDLSHLRWTIDTAADLAMARAVYSHLYRPGRVFRFEDVLSLLDKHPEISALNATETRSAMYQKAAP